MKKILVVLTIVAAVLTSAAYFIGGLPLMKEGLLVSGSMFLETLPLIIVAFLVIGQMQTLITKDWMEKTLDKFSGMRGILLSSFAGGLFPGPPFVFYPFVAAFIGRGLPLYILFSLIMGKLLWDFMRLPMEIALITPEIALLRNLITLPFPILVGWIIYRIFGSRSAADVLKRGDEEL